MDIESAYRLILVNSQDWPLQAVQWKGEIYQCSCLACLSSENIQCCGRCLCLAMECQGIPFVLHYLDDFIIIGPLNTNDCQRYVEVKNRECVVLGILVAEHKWEGPTTWLTFLGIEIDSVQGIMSYPPRKWTILGSCRTSGKNGHHAPGKSWSQ